MVTNAEQADPGLPIEEQAEMFARNVIAGHPQGSVRRIILYSALAGNLMGLAILTNGHPLGIAMGVIGAVAFVLLLATDQLL